MGRPGTVLSVIPKERLSALKIMVKRLKVELTVRTCGCEEMWQMLACVGVVCVWCRGRGRGGQSQCLA